MKLIRVSEVAQLLAVREATVRKWIREGQLPVVKMGRVVAIKESDVEQMIRDNYVRRQGKKHGKN